MAAETKAHEKVWHPVGSDIGLATVTTATTTVPARAVTSSGPAGPEEREDPHARPSEHASAAAADGGERASAS
eukprot:5574728-Alexandrium_andersonii.AAC.1